MLSHILLWMCRRSWRIYQLADFTARDGEHSIPIIRGLGLDLFRRPDVSLLSAVRHVAKTGRRGWYVDVGANLGQSLLLFLREGLSYPYLGFEPNLDTAYYARRLIEVNALTDCHVLPIGLSSREGFATLHLSAKGDESGTVETQMRPLSMYGKFMRVSLSTGDRQLADLDDIFFIKLDCEGHEIQALEGMREVIESKRPPLYFEVMGYGHLIDGTYPREYFGELSEIQVQSIADVRRRNCQQLDALMTSFRYRITKVSDNQWQPVARITDSLPGEGEMNFLAEPVL